MAALATINGYLKCRDDERLWDVVAHNETIAENVSMPEALEVARRTFGRVTMSVWDCERCEFISELVADPNY